eukprot:594544-Pelagomonas_calceolata.AAC.1
MMEGGGRRGWILEVNSCHGFRGQGAASHLQGGASLTVALVFAGAAAIAPAASAVAVLGLGA